MPTTLKRAARPRMTVCARIGFLIVLCIASDCHARAAGQTGKPVQFESRDKTLHGLIYKPEGTGPFRALLYNHGSAPALLNNEAFERIAPILVKHGWVFFAPYRRGQGLSADAGPYIGDAIDKARARGGVQAAAETMVQLLSTEQLQDQMNALAWLKKQSFIKADKIAAMGNSFGGVETVLGAAEGGYCAAVDVAGGARAGKWRHRFNTPW